MYKKTPTTKPQLVSAVPGHIPDQAVIFGGRPQNGNMYVVSVTDGSTTEGGLYETNKSCAEYLEFNLFGPNVPKCVSTFQFLVVRQGKCYLWLSL